MFRKIENSNKNFNQKKISITAQVIKSRQFLRGVQHRGEGNFDKKREPLPPQVCLSWRKADNICRPGKSGKNPWPAGGEQLLPAAIRLRSRASDEILSRNRIRGWIFLQTVWKGFLLVLLEFCLKKVWEGCILFFVFHDLQLIFITICQNSLISYDYLIFFISIIV